MPPVFCSAPDLTLEELEAELGLIGSAKQILTALDIATSKGHNALAKHLPGGSHNFTKINLKEAACVHCGRVVGKGRAGLWCVACGSCRACAIAPAAAVVAGADESTPTEKEKKPAKTKKKRLSLSRSPSAGA